MLVEEALRSMQQSGADEAESETDRKEPTAPPSQTRQRRTARLRSTVQLLMSEGVNFPGESLLERRAVRTLATKESYRLALSHSSTASDSRKLPSAPDSEVELAFVSCSNFLYLRGVQHHQDSQLLAAVMDMRPHLSRSRRRKVPIFRRA